MWKVSHCEIGGDDLNDLKSQLNIRDLQDIGESQADHKNKINPLIISRYQGIFLLRFFTYTYSTSIERHGSSITKVVPIPSWESTNTRPFIFSTISLQIDKPKPAP